MCPAGDGPHTAAPAYQLEMYVSTQGARGVLATRCLPVGPAAWHRAALPAGSAAVRPACWAGQACPSVSLRPGLFQTWLVKLAEALRGILQPLQAGLPQCGVQWCCRLQDSLELVGVRMT